jgi:hypothetical protein
MDKLIRCSTTPESGGERVRLVLLAVGHAPEAPPKHRLVV